MSNARPQDRSAKRQALLGELAEIGMALARDLPRQAAEPEADLDGIALKYARISRAVRQTLALEARFEQEGLEWASQAAKRRGDRRKRDVEDLVMRVIASEFSGGVAENKIEGLYERLLDDLDEDYVDAPLPILAAQVCRDLGVPFDPALWEEGEVPPPLGEVSAEPTEGVRSDLGGPPQSLRDSSPNGGATGTPGFDSAPPWRSSA